MKNLFGIWGILLLLLFPITLKSQSEQVISRLVVNEEQVGDRIIYAISGVKLQGVYRIYDKDDSFTITAFSNGMKHGSEETYDPDEILLSKGNYTNGVKDGTWNYYDTYHRILVQSENYKNGKAEGVWSYYNRQLKTPIKEEVYEDNLLTSVREYNYEGTLTGSSFYKDGLRSGVWVTYYFDSKIKSKTSYALNRKNGLYESFHSNGQLSTKGNYEDGKYIGDWISYYDNGTVSLRFSVKGKGENKSYPFESFYPDGKPKRKGIAINEHLSYFDKVLYEYYSNGQLESEVSYNRIRREGPYKYCYENGQIKEIGAYKEGFKTGEVKAFYSNGKPKSVIVYGSKERNVNEGRYLMNGLYRTFYEDGTLKEEGTYIEEVKDGVWKSFKEDGSPYFIEVYEMGILVKNVDKSEYSKYLK
jgi:antitoxin component YwqK of YwqJK toxin-antitoxin module